MRAHVGARHVIAVFLVGVAVRLVLLRLPGLWYDEATSGIMGLTVLQGVLPVYFYGQPFMGALDAYVAAPLFIALGVSARSLELLPVVLACGWLALVLRLAWDAYGSRAALFAALLLALPPDFLLYWAHEARGHYPMTMVLGTLAVALALRAPVAPLRRAALHLGLLGGVLGLAFWTNFLSLVFWPPVAVLLVMRGFRAGTLPVALAAVPAFVLGSLPHWLYGLQHGTALPPPGHRIRLAELLAHLDLVGRVSWPILTGVPAELRGTRAGTLVSLALAVAYGWAVVAAARAARRGPPAARRTSLALLVLIAVNVGVAVGTQYGRMLDDHDQKYLLPLYTALPVLLGRWLSELRPWRLGAAVAGALLLVHGAGAATSAFRDLAPAVAAAERAELHAELDTVAALERDGLVRLYAPDLGTRTLTFLSGGRVIFANHYEEIYPPYARAVDGAETAAWWLGGRDPVFDANLAALGVRFAYRPVGSLGGVYTDFAGPAGALRELDPARFTVTASHASPTAGWIADRDAASLWSTGRPKRGGEWIEVDLGRVEPVALVRWLPGAYQEVPGGLRLELSQDGASWRRVIELPAYAGPLYWSGGRPMARVRGGRVELRVPPTPTRYLRLTQTGTNPVWPWTVRELFVYAATGGASPAVPAADGPTLARALRAGGVTRLYADHGWGARVALADPEIRILPANLWLDAYGFMGPPEEFWPRVRWGPGSGALLEVADAESFAAVARASGLGFTDTALGGLVLFAYAAPPPRPGPPLPRTTLTVSASRHPERAALAADGDPTTRWTTARPQAPGDWVGIDLGAPRAVRAVRLWTAHPTDSPRGLALEGSEDGVTWRPIPADLRTEGPLRWGGIALLHDGVEAVRLDFAPMRLRALRLTLTRGDPVFDWSIHELTVYAAE